MQALSPSCLRFGAVYGIEGTSGRRYAVYPAGTQLPFPSGVVDPAVENVVQQIKTKAEQQNLPISDLIVTRAGGPYMGEPDFTDEVRIILTGEDAVEFEAHRPQVAGIIDALEQNRTQQEQADGKLISVMHREMELEDNRSLWDKLRGNKPELSWVEQDVRSEARKYSESLKTELAAINADYAKVVQPILRDLKAKVKGYLSVGMAQERLNQGTFDIENGLHPDDKTGDSYWWYS